MHCQQFTLKYITLAYQILQFRPNQFYHRDYIHYIIPSLLVTNTQMFLQSRAPRSCRETMYLLDPPLIGPGHQHICQDTFVCH